MKPPKISIVVPVYNVEKYIHRCMNSLLAQTLNDIEIILIDDGSPDGCPQICDDYAKQDSRVKVIHKKNGGLGYARNSGITAATGSYIAFVDSDDYVHEKMYETLYNNACEKNYDVVYCGLRREIANGIYINRACVTAPASFIGKNEVINVMLDFIASAPNVAEERKYEMSVWHSIYKNDIIQQHQLSFYSEREYASEDLPFQVDFLKHAHSVLFIPDIFYTYCFNEGSLTTTFSNEKYPRFKKLYQLLQRQAKDYDKDCLRVNRFFIGYARSHIFNIVAAQISAKEKFNLIAEICEDAIWDKIGSEYSDSYLKSYQRMIYNATRKKQITKLYLLSKLINTGKKILKK